MVLLLNILLPVVVLGGLLTAWKIKKFWPIAVVMLFSLVYMFVQPSYIPKGSISRTALPPFEESQAEIQDRNLAPQPMSEYDAERERKIKEGLPFIE